MLPFYKEQFGNPSSVHWAGRQVSGALEKAREQVASLLNASPAEIVFVSCGSEGDNMAIKGSLDPLKEKGNHIITTTVEHPAVLETCQALEKDGYDVTYLPVKRAITDKTILISIMWANNETGNLYPIEEIGRIAKKYNIRLRFLLMCRKPMSTCWSSPAIKLAHRKGSVRSISVAAHV
jgi:cysteine desulfurase